MKGTVVSKKGPHAVKVLTQCHNTTQNFVTGKITETSFMGHKVWPLKEITTEPVKPVE